jgi:hypothetical protein
MKKSVLLASAALVMFGATSLSTAVIARDRIDRDPQRHEAKDKVDHDRKDDRGRDKVDHDRKDDKGHDKVDHDGPGHK